MKLEHRNWDTSEVIKPLADHANFIKSLLNIEDIAPEGKKGHLDLSHFNKRIVNAIIEEGIKGNLDKAQKILDQKLKVEKTNGGINKLPEDVVSEIIPTIKQYIEENKEKITQDLQTPVKKQPLAENLRNIESKINAPDIQGNANIVPKEIMGIKKPDIDNQTERVDFLNEIVPQEIEKNISKSEIPTGKTSEGVISVVTDKNGEIKLHTNEDTQDMKKVFHSQQNTPKKEVGAIIEPAMKEKSPQEKPELNKFSALEKEAEKIKLQYKNELNREFKNNPNDPVVKAFDENPNLWIRSEISNRIAYLKKASEKVKTGNEKQAILNKIISLENKIPPINYLLKKETLNEIKEGNTLLITENGNTVKYKIVSIDTEKVGFQKEGYPLTMFLSRTAMEDFLLDPKVSFRKEKIRPENKNTKKEVLDKNTESKNETQDKTITQKNYEQKSAEYARRLEENNRQQIENSYQIRETNKKETSPEELIIQDNLWEQWEQLRKEEKEIIEEWIAEDKKQKPFAYFVASRVDGDMLEHLTEDGSTSLDLRFLEDDSEENFECISQFPIRDSGEDSEYYATYFEYNIAGFRKIIEDPNAIRTKDGFDIHSNKTRYMITGPGGMHKIDIKGYDEATRIYKEATKRYLQKMRREFESSQESMKKEEVPETKETPTAVTENTSESTMEGGGNENKKTPELKTKSKEDILLEAKEKIQTIQEKYNKRRDEIIDQFLKNK